MPRPVKGALGQRAVVEPQIIERPMVVYKRPKTVFQRFAVNDICDPIFLAACGITALLAVLVLLKDHYFGRNEPKSNLDIVMWGP